ncbi:MAG: HAMP domain-containing protein [Syntrophobacteraceae bacterium]|nr:HAMP domain-containing protein [Syntrophobacteraceae bacterium]
MNLQFRHKVFLTFLFSSLTVVISMIFIGRYYAHRNFEEYIGRIEMERLKELADALSDEYRKSDNWDRVLNYWDQWKQTAVRPGPHPGSHFALKPPLPPLLPQSPTRAFPGKGESAFPTDGSVPDFRREAPRLCLFDPEKRPLTDTPSTCPDSYRLKPVMAGGQLVGWIGMRKLQPPSHPLDVEFIRDQSLTFYSIGGVSLALAVLMTIVLSRQLLAPMKHLAEATRALTSRRFETRIAVGSRDELGQLAADFNTMAQALERYEQMRRQWIADISHELRTPLAVLRGEIEAMQDGVRELTPKALDSLHFEVLHVSRIVQDLHDLSLIESETVNAAPAAVNPLRVLDETIRTFHARFETCGIRIDADERVTSAPVILADPDRLRQLYSNLFENTLRYARTPGDLRIQHSLESGRLCLRFEDSGPGVPEESIERLFDRLYRVDAARSRDRGGSGLGLAICRSIVERYGGEITASNAPARGLRITIDFPVLPG